MLQVCAFLCLTITGTTSFSTLKPHMQHCNTMFQACLLNVQGSLSCLLCGSSWLDCSSSSSFLRPRGCLLNRYMPIICVKGRCQLQRKLHSASQHQSCQEKVTVSVGLQVHCSFDFSGSSTDLELCVCSGKQALCPAGCRACTCPQILATCVLQEWSDS